MIDTSFLNLKVSIYLNLAFAKVAILLDFIKNINKKFNYSITRYWPLICVLS